MSRSLSLLCAAAGVALLLSSMVGCTPRGKSETSVNTSAKSPPSPSPNTTSRIYGLALTDGVTLDLSTAPQASVLLSEAKIEKALSREATFTFIDASLSEVCEQLAYLFQVDFELDYVAMQEIGVGPQMPIRATVSGIPLSLALDQVVDQTGLDWTVADGAVLFSSEEQIESRQLTKIFEVTDLVVCRDGSDVLWDDFDSLIEAITANVTPTSWDMVGGPGSVTSSYAGAARVLIVSQSYRSHREIARLLEVLRQIAKGRKIDSKPPLRNPACAM